MSQTMRDYQKGLVDQNNPIISALGVMCPLLGADVWVAGNIGNDILTSTNRADKIEFITSEDMANWLREFLNSQCANNKHLPYRIERNGVDYTATINSRTYQIYIICPDFNSEWDTQNPNNYLKHTTFFEYINGYITDGESYWVHDLALAAYHTGIYTPISGDSEELIRHLKLGFQYNIEKTSLYTILNLENDRIMVGERFNVYSY